MGMVAVVVPAGADHRPHGPQPSTAAQDQGPPGSSMLNRIREARSRGYRGRCLQVT